MSPSITIISFLVYDVVSGKVVEIASDVVIVLDGMVSGVVEVESLMDDAVIVLDDMVSLKVSELTLLKEDVVTD